MKKRKSKYLGRKKYVEAYKKERKRITSYVSSMKRRGYDISNVVIPDIPKTITQGSVSRLKKISAKELRSNMSFTNPETGETVRASNRVGVRRLQKEIRTSAQNMSRDDVITLIEEFNAMNPYTPIEIHENAKVDYSNIPNGVKIDVNKMSPDSVIDDFLSKVAECNNKNAYKIVLDWLEDWMSTFGKDDVAKVLELAAESGIRLDVTEEDSYPTAKMKSNKFIRKIMKLSGEYSDEYLDEIFEDLESISGWDLS